MSSHRIRPIDSSHIGDLIRIAEETNLNRWTAAHYVDELANQNAIMLRIEGDENATIGFIVGRVVIAADDDNAVDAEIYNIGVDPLDQRRGFGQLLMDTFFGICRKKEVRSIWLEVRESNLPARAIYEKNGFAAVAVRQNFYADPVENGIVMRRNLVDPI